MKIILMKVSFRKFFKFNREKNYFTINIYICIYIYTINFKIIDFEIIGPKYYLIII